MDFLKAFDSLLFAAGFLLVVVATVAPVTTKWFTLVLSRLQRSVFAILGLACMAFSIALHADYLPSSGIPIGTIVAWDPILRGQDGQRRPETRELPKGWRVCDGTNGTPNLSERFLMGVLSPALAGSSAGSNVIEPAGAHNHGGVTGAFAGYAQGKINFDRGVERNDPFMPVYTIAQVSNHDHGGDKRPANYSVVYLCKFRPAPSP